MHIRFPGTKRIARICSIKRLTQTKNAICRKIISQKFGDCDKSHYLCSVLNQ